MRDVGGRIRAALVYARTRPDAPRARRTIVRRAWRVAACAAAAMTTVPATAGAQAPTDWDTSPAVEQRVDALLGQMTLEERVDLATGETNNFFGFYNNGNARLGIPALQMADGPIGVRIADPNVFEQKATALPAGLALASTWDRALASRYGDLMGDEAHRTNHNVQLGPSVDIARTPLGARAFEALGEDPLLSGDLAAREIRAIQAHHVIATIKHYTANNQENNRDQINAQVGERALREIYTRPIEDAVQRGKVGAAMCAFNRVNAAFACANRHLLTDILKGDIGFRGFVMSDYSATPSTVGSANAGLDQEQPGCGAPSGGSGNPGACKWGANLLAAIQNGQVSVDTLNDKVRRILRAMVGIGVFDDPPTVTPIPVAAHGQVAREIARQGIVLLKNRARALPLDESRLHSIAVVGPDADTYTAGGGSSLVKPTYTVTPLDAIRDRAPGATVRYAPGTDPIGAGALIPGLPPIPSDVLRPAGGAPDDHGLRGEYWTNTTWSGAPQHVQTDPSAQAALGFYNFSGFNANSPKLPAVPTDFNNRASIRWTGQIVPPVTGRYTLSLTSAGTARLYIDDQLVLENSNDAPGNADFQSHSLTINLTAGQARSIRVDYAADAGKQASFTEGSQVRLGWQPPAGTIVQRVRDAVDLARQSDVAIVVLRNYSSEGWIDQPNLDLPNNQADLVRRVAAANPRTIVVMMTGTPVKTASFDSRVPALLEAWFAGQEQGHAIADVLFGDVNPSGHLPVTFPVNEKQTPLRSPRQYPGVNGTADYSEGVFVGYRGYREFGLRPRYPFGWGLSYTTFAYSRLRIRAGHGGKVRVRFRLRNTGQRAGAEVAQVYVGRLPTGVRTPPRQLAGFAKVSLEPGERRTVTVRLDRRSLSYWSTARGRWVTPKGKVRVFVGSNSRQVALRGWAHIRP
jgi:beta-glucosidase